MRQITFEPGAARATFSISASQSMAYIVMPSLWAVAISRGHFDVHSPDPVARPRSCASGETCCDVSRRPAHTRHRIDGCLGPDEGNPVRTVGKDGQASSVIRQAHAPGDTKKALPSL